MDFSTILKDVQLQAKEFNYLNHYTTIDILELILKNQSLLLNRIDRVNDLMEHSRIDAFLDKKGYVSCFTYREHESYFFWKVYSHKIEDKIGVRISFPTDILDQKKFYFDSECKKPLSIIAKTDNRYNKYDSDNYWGLQKHTASKIIYADSLEDFCRVEEDLKNAFSNCVNLKDETFEYALLPCLVKTREWDSEEEIRIVVLVRPKGPETILGRTVFIKKKYPQPKFDSIYLKLPKEILGKCMFTISPFCNEKYEEAVNIIRSYEITKACSINKSVMSVRV